MSDNKENMYFDTTTFDFSSLTDIVGLNDDTENEHTESSVGADGGVVDDISDLVGNFEENEEESEETEEEHEVEEEIEEEEVEPDDEEVDFEDYRINLPDGTEVVLSELVKGYRSSEELNTAIADFQEAQEEFVQKSQDIGRLLDLAKLEADRTIEDYAGFDWSRYKAEDPAGYVENREYLDRFIERRKEIITAMEARDNALREEEQSRKAAEAVEAGKVLQRDIPGWSKALYEELMDYAVANGADKDYILNSTDPTMFKILHKALQFEKGKKTVTAKIKRVGGTPTKVAKPNAKPAPKEADVERVKATISKMGSSRQANVEAFKYLKD